MATSPLLTPREAADYLRTTVGALAQHRYRGDGPRYYAPSRKMVRYRKDWIDEWLAENERTGTAE